MIASVRHMPSQVLMCLGVVRRYPRCCLESEFGVLGIPNLIVKNAKEKKAVGVVRS